jgi:hypothetical protein
MAARAQLLVVRERSVVEVVLLLLRQPGEDSRVGVDETDVLHGVLPGSTMKMGP